MDRFLLTGGHLLERHLADVTKITVAAYSTSIADVTAAAEVDWMLEQCLG